MKDRTRVKKKDCTFKDTFEISEKINNSDLQYSHGDINKPNLSNPTLQNQVNKNLNSPTSNNENNKNIEDTNNATDNQSNITPNKPEQNNYSNDNADRP